MNGDHSATLEHCVSVLDTFDPVNQAVEDHLEDYLLAHQDLGDPEQTFIAEVFAGCVRYHRALQVVLDGFFVRDGRRVLRSEGNIFKVIAYLALFRLDELGVAQFRRFIRSRDANKMYKFLNFLLDEHHYLHTWMKDEWNKLYEGSFVQTTLMSPLIRWLPELQELVCQLKDKVDNNIKLKKPNIPTTETKPFNITKPRPRSVPMPLPIPKLQRHRPVPKTTYVNPEEQNVMQKIKAENRRKAEERLMEASRAQFTCANPEKSAKTRNKLQNIMDQEEAKLDFEKHKSNPIPSAILNQNIPIKLNTAAILREGKLYKKREEEQLKKIELLEAGARDPSQFLEWQNKMRQADMDSQLADIERRRLEGKLSHEEAILARQNLIRNNKEKVLEMKEEAAELMREFLDKKLEEEQQMRKLVEEVMEGHENAKDAKKKLQEYKATIVAEMNEESRELMTRALEEAEAEMRQRMELIQQIRAMEATPVNRFKLVDFTETAGHGLLSEMSIAELRERLSFLRLTEEEEEEEKRDDILASKQAKDQMLMDTLQTISRHRTETCKAAAIKLENRKKTHLAKPEIKDPKLLELQAKLEAKRAQRKQEQEQSRLTPDKKSAQRIRQLNSAKKTGEELRWQELERTREKSAQLHSKGILGSQSASRLMNNRTVLTYS